MLRSVHGPSHQLCYEGQATLTFVVGLGLLAFGLGMVVVPRERLGFLPVGVEADPLLWTWRLCGGFVAVAGLATLGYRKGAVLDRRARTLTLWWGVFGLRRVQEHGLVGATVGALPVEVPYDQGTTTEYSVQLRQHGQVLLELYRLENQDEAERQAWELADFLGIPVEADAGP
jgi:hypothetical protein